MAHVFLDIKQKRNHDQHRSGPPLPFPFLSSELSRSSCLPAEVAGGPNMRRFLVICTIHGNPKPSFLGVITHILGCKTCIFHGFGVQGMLVLNLRFLFNVVKSTCKNRPKIWLHEHNGMQFLLEKSIEFGMIRKGLLIKGFSKIPSIYQLRRCELKPPSPETKKEYTNKNTHFRYMFGGCFRQKKALFEEIFIYSIPNLRSLRIIKIMSGWWFHPIRKYKSKWESSPNRGETKNI